MQKPTTSTVKTRQTDEKLRKIEMVGYVSHQIVGAKLPSNRQALEVFFYNMRFVKLTSKESAKLTIDSVIIFWQQARIPFRELHKCAAKLLKMYDEWQKLTKTKVEKMSAAMNQKCDKFFGELDNLFDIAHADATAMIRNEEDKEFLENQRKNGRPGAMLGIDTKLAAKEERSRLRREQEELRRIKHEEALQKSREYCG